MPERDASADGESDRKFVVALARGLDVLRAFKPGDGLLGNHEIAVRTGLPKPTVTRLTYTLTRLGYLTAVPRFGKYELAPAALALGYAALANLGVRHVAQIPMQELADLAGGAVALGGPDRNSMIYVSQARGESAFTVRLDIGSRIPMATTAMGRAYLAVLPAHEREQQLLQMAPRYGARWPQVRDGVERALEFHARRGFTISVGEWQDDVHSVGAPFIPHDGSRPMAFNCGAPAFRFTRDRLENDIGPRLVALVRSVEATLNGASPRPSQPEQRGRQAARAHTGGNPHAIVPEEAG
ncbi:transcriptional regulator [Alsobacter metallidurans]|uniref:Transcriptional regulator n=1 Tax=Alsobacter metallidurans TaxID=340221 RepID=A0A917IBE2_9HYPH|nr:IclR family transcriptional regulator [Alsobacter metallidurans]GGH30912.1 transcriptional regulator [Alsobacter metallidurans]